MVDMCRLQSASRDTGGSELGTAPERARSGPAVVLEPPPSRRGCGGQGSHGRRPAAGGNRSNFARVRSGPCRSNGCRHPGLLRNKAVSRDRLFSFPSRSTAHVLMYVVLLSSGFCYVYTGETFQWNKYVQVNRKRTIIFFVCKGG
jgi:hypothetical protein